MVGLDHTPTLENADNCVIHHGVMGTKQGNVHEMPSTRASIRRGLETIQSVTMCRWRYCWSVWVPGTDLCCQAGIAAIENSKQSSLITDCS